MQTTNQLTAQQKLFTLIYLQSTRVLLMGNSRNVNILLTIFPVPKAYHRPSTGLGTVLLSCLISELEKPSSLGLKFRTNFYGCGLCSYNLFAKTKKNWLWCWSSIVLSIQTTENIFTRTQTKDVFQGSNLSLCNLFKINNFGLGTIF
jgi:hypothetical protein